jgi:putative transposase
MGVDIGDSEDASFWTQFLCSLKQLGLGGVKLVTADVHVGVKKSIRKCFSGSSWQRCRVPYIRNLLAAVPKGQSEVVAAAFRSNFALAIPADIDARWDEVANMLDPKFLKAAESMRTAKVDVLGFAVFRKLIGARSGRTTRWNG